MSAGQEGSRAQGQIGANGEERLAEGKLGQEEEEDGPISQSWAFLPRNRNIGDLKGLGQEEVLSRLLGTRWALGSPGE
jgi:hypothetical protein